MAMVDEVTAALREMEPDLLKPTQSAMAAVTLGERIRAVRKLLAEHGDRWISVAEAKRLLAASSAESVKAWAHRGYLRSRTLPNGRIQLSLDDVLRDREATEALTGVDNGEPITPEEAMYLLRPLEYPRPAGYPERIRRADPAR